MLSCATMVLQTFCDIFTQELYIHVMKLDFQKSYGCDYPALSGYDPDLGRIKTTGF